MAESTHETTIVISGNANGAVSAFARVTNSIKAARTSIGHFISLFSRLNWVVSSVKNVIDAFKWLRDKITEASRELAKFKFDLAMRSAASETARLVGFHEKLAKLLKEELDTLAKQRAVEGITAGGKKDHDDAKREADRARAIFLASGPEEERALRNQFAAEDERRATEDRKAQRRQEIKRLDDEESVYSSKAGGLKANNLEIDEQLKTEKFNLVRANGNEKYEETVKERIAALEARKKANEAEIREYEKEAKFRRDQIAALESQKDYEGPAAGEWQRRIERRKDAEGRLAAAREQQSEVEDAVLANRKLKEIAALDPNADDYEEKKAGIERSYAEKEAVVKVERAKDEGQRFLAEKELEQVRLVNEISRREDEAAERGKAEAERKDFLGRIAETEGVSVNRLTAIGLGSGVKGRNPIEGDVKEIIRILKAQVDATKSIAIPDQESVFEE